MRNSEKIRVAINGAGRIGRAFFRAARERLEIEVVAMNDVGDIKNIAYLLKYDTVYGRSNFDVLVRDDGRALVIDGRQVVFLSEKDPANLPWKNLNIDVVVESTGFFTSHEKSKAHIVAGAKKVVITAPVKDQSSKVELATGQVASAGGRAPTVLMGINEGDLKTCQISSNASCTTNAGGPVIVILHETIGIEKALLNTTHGYTARQSIVDSPSKKDFKEGRAAAQNIVPTTTGAAIAVTKAIPDLEGRFDGISMRVPVAAGSIADITFIAKRNTSVEEVNSILKKAAKEKRWEGIFTVTEDPIVSSDIIGSKYGSIADLGLTRVVAGNLVKVCAWYDNEMGYAYTLVQHVIETGKYVERA